MSLDLDVLPKRGLLPDPAALLLHCCMEAHNTSSPECAACAWFQTAATACSYFQGAKLPSMLSTLQQEEGALRVRA